MANWFCVNSAVNISSGIFDSNKRFEQTLDTAESIRKYCPDPIICLVDGSPIPFTDEQRTKLKEVYDHVLEFSDDPMIKFMHTRYNIQQLKSPCDFYLTEQFLIQMPIKETDRVFRITGRYKLSEKFNIEQHKVDKLVIAPKGKSCLYFDRQTGKNYEPITEYQYIRARLYSFPGTMIPYMRDKYNQMSQFFWELYKTSFSDLEHVLYKFIDPEMVMEVPTIGVTGVFAERDQLVDE